MDSPRLGEITADLEKVEEEKMKFEEELESEEFTCVQQVEKLQLHLIE